MRGTWRFARSPLPPECPPLRLQPLFAWGFGGAGRQPPLPFPSPPWQSPLPPQCGTESQPGGDLGAAMGCQSGETDGLGGFGLGQTCLFGFHGERPGLSCRWPPELPRGGLWPRRTSPGPAAADSGNGRARRRGAWVLLLIMMIFSRLPSRPAPVPAGTRPRLATPQPVALEFGPGLAEPAATPAGRGTPSPAGSPGSGKGGKCCISLGEPFGVLGSRGNGSQIEGGARGAGTHLSGSRVLRPCRAPGRQLLVPSVSPFLAASLP